MSAIVRLFDEILSRIRTHGSLLLSAGLASDEYEDWNAVIACGKMIQKDAERGLDLLDQIEALTEAEPTETDNGNQTQETCGQVQDQGGR